jgi:glucan biosynthesis protein C
VRRLLVPFLFGVLVIVPVQAYLAIVWRGGSGSISAFTSDYWSFQREIFGYDGGFTPGHLWFILYLFLYAVVAAPLFARWHERPGPRRWVRWYLIGMPLVMWFGDGLPWAEDGPQNLFYSFALFIGGFLLMSEPRLEGAVDRAWRWLVPAALALIGLRLWLVWSGTYESWDTGVMSVLLDIFRFTVTWVVVLALLALGRRFLTFEIPFLRWANEGAYPIYLLHQSVIIVVAYAVLESWGAPPVAGFLVVTGTSLAATVAIYEWLVRPFDPARFLFGMKPRTPAVTTPRPAVPVGG